MYFPHVQSTVAQKDTLIYLTSMQHTTKHAYAKDASVVYEMMFT